MAKASRYLLLLYGKGDGCDYTIGCNQRIIALKAAGSFAEAVQEATQEIRDLNPDEIKTAELVEIGRLESLAMVLADEIKRRQMEGESITERSERELYEKLKAKYGE